MKNHVCMVVYSDYPFDARVRREAETIASDPRFDVSVLALKQNPLPSTYMVDGVRVIEMNVSRYRGNSLLGYFISYLNFLCLCIGTCSTMTVRSQLDVLHVHNMPNSLVFVGLLPKLLGRKVIFDMHDSVPETYTAKFDNSSRRLYELFCLEESICCALADKIICVNHPQRNLLVSRGIGLDKTVISMNVPDPQRFRARDAQQSSRTTPRSLKLVYHGTVAERLGVDLAIRAVEKLSGRLPDLEFHIWGGGEHLDYCVRLAEVLNIANRVYFKQSVPLDVLPKVLREMDIGIIPNRNNIATQIMLPVKMLEYVAMGIPVIAPRLKTIEYYFSEDMVYYFEPENVDSMASAILKLYKDKSAREKQAEKAKAFLDRYGWDKHKMDLIRLYESL